ncbi:MAG: hypothetical protein ACT4TC_20475 [Myxococcaceae bacterium]
MNLLKRPPFRPTIAAVAFAAAGCTGTSDFATSRTAQPAPVGNSGTAEPAPVADVPALKVSRQQLQLLPFRVRLAKVAAVVGLPVTDAVFNDLRANRFELGDYDYANGVNADVSWTSSKMSLWVRSLRAPCAAPATKALYPSLPADLEKLLLSAYGRRAVASDRALVEDALSGSTVDEASRYQAICLAVLTSAEFVSR